MTKKCESGETELLRLNIPFCLKPKLCFNVLQATLSERV